MRRFLLIHHPQLSLFFTLFFEKNPNTNTIYICLIYSIYVITVTHKQRKQRNMATETKADHYNSQLSLKNLLRSHFNTNSPLLSALNSLQLLLVLVLCTCTFAAFSQSIVTTLPGYAGDLPFKLETGYVSVGEWNDVHLFYYFIESEGNPREDPLILWLTGGPGCSSFGGLIFEIGPLHFEKDYFDGTFPNLAVNPFSWTKAASMIFLDAPVGAGFSYADNPGGYVSNDLLYATDTYNFLLKWLMDHPTFLSNELYIGGDSYSGLIVPIVVQKIYNGNFEVPVQRQLKLQGYILGNPVTSQHDDKNARIEYAHRLTLLSDKLYKSIKHNCHGEYIIIDPNNAPCIRDLTLVNQCLANLCMGQILEPNCAYASRNSSKLKWDRRFIEEEPTDFLLLPVLPKFWCRTYNYISSYIWANDERVRQALHIRKGTKEKWARCNESMAYTEVVFNSLDYHRNLSHTTLRALIYSGDHDMAVPYLGTHKWIEALNLTVDEEWRPWFVDGQNGGYTMSYVRKGYHLTFATIKARKKN
ncbi:serine carboxypeptidase-like 2 isoform X2 [Rhododendron vialii]|uniref:serine carboxypeptidase-like 2 isoform X2 n=1 Tax=Rhododendron vialii TaxID=182163 RepID=UPI00265DD884|nr:serine carboxypeptidase-like 2 isoform X2 [Rhododendron vialii]